MNSASDQRLFCPLYLEGGGRGGGGLMMFTVIEAAKGQLSSGAGSLVNSSLSLGGNFHRFGLKNFWFSRLYYYSVPNSCLRYTVVRLYLQY
jgi:hypothetical protein